MCLNKVSSAHSTIQPLSVEMILWHFLCKIPLFLTHESCFSADQDT